MEVNETLLIVVGDVHGDIDQLMINCSSYVIMQN